MPDPAERERALERVREICLALPETSERLSHSAPTFFVRGKRAFVMVMTTRGCGSSPHGYWGSWGPAMSDVAVESGLEEAGVEVGEAGQTALESHVSEH